MIFSEYFDNWSKSYYSKGINVGKSGDFYTAVSVGELFGFLCAKRFLQLIYEKTLTLPIDIIEIGANEGYFLNDFYKYLNFYKKDILPFINFYIAEPHEQLRTIQKQNCKFNFTHINLDDFKSENAFLIANELFDAFSCELYDNEKLAFVNNHSIYFKECEKNHIYLQNKNFKKGEFSPYLWKFLNILNNNFKSFYFLTFDYFNEFLKDDFSIKIFKNHNILNPFDCDLQELYGVCDITYNVNYDELKFYFDILEISHFLKKQSVALMDFGLDEFSDPKYINQIKHLMFGFSDNFKCLEFFKIRK